MSSATPLDVGLGGDLLIEASAGTGKTYALTTLAARLVVEAELAVDRLLVVTFTVAATGELRARLRRTLLATRNATAAPSADADSSGDGAQGLADDRQAGALLRRWRRIGIDLVDANARLAAAVRELDRANIMTIHGFCQRLLAEFAFDGGIPFGFRVSGDDAAEVALAVRDFWRRRIAPAAPQQLEFAAAERFTLAAATDWVRERQGRAGLQIRGVDDGYADSETERQAWRRAFDAARTAWKDGGAGFDNALQTLNWFKNSRPKIFAVWQRARRAFAAADAFGLPLAEAGYLGGSSLQRVLRKGQQLPPLPLFDCFDALGEVAEQLGPRWLREVRRDLLQETRRALRDKAWERRCLSFDGLLTEAERALRSSPILAQRLRERFPVALIDEFQDTDALQARIFESIYAASGNTAVGAGGVAIVGDPKQSIYGFRGADVFAYLDASRRLADMAGERLRLTTNFRSTPALVRSVNALFARPDPFLLREIEFKPSASFGTGAGALVLDDAVDAAPLQLRLFPGDDKVLAKERFQTIAAQGVAREIAELLRLAGEGRATLRGQALAGGDIAVLVRTRAQGQAVAQELRRQGVQSVEMSDASIFQTEAASQLHRLLHALAASAGTRAAAQLRGALGMDLFGLDMRELARLRTDDRVWAHWQERFGEWRTVWREAGVATLIRRLLFAASDHGASQLLRYPDGARRLTNMLHLADLLRQAEASDRLSPVATVEWLAEQRRSATAGDSAQLRLESDESLVKVLTVHRAKGLEFPLVFCPFAWYRRGFWQGATATYHERGRERFDEILDLAPSKDAHERQQVEDHAEELRLLYVALTRAQYRCVVTWARVRGAEHAPLVWLLHARALATDTPVAALRVHERHMKKLGAVAWQAEAMAFVAENEGDVAASALADWDVPSAEEAATHETNVSVVARRLARPLLRVRQITSYSALAAEAGAAVTEPEHAEVERADHDQREDAAWAAERPGRADVVFTPPARGVAASAGNAKGRQDAFAFPRGRRAGDCLHELFEARVDGVALDDVFSQQTLQKHGIDPKWAPTARTMVDDARATALTPTSERHGGTFRIADLVRPIAEMEFQLPVLLDRAELNHCLAAHGYGSPFGEPSPEVVDAPAAGQGSTALPAVNGYLRGFVDLVAEYDGRWYVIDYKSNWLGDALTAYSPAALRQAMRGNHYHLQYLLYLTALHRYLRLKLPGYRYQRHIGGALYLFVRGMRPDRPAHGVFHDLPAAECIEAIDNCFRTPPSEQQP